MPPKKRFRKSQQGRAGESPNSHIERAPFRGRSKNFAERTNFWNHHEPKTVEALMNIELKSLFKCGFYSNHYMPDKKHFGGEADRILQHCQQARHSYSELERTIWSIVHHLEEINNLGPGGKAALTLVGSVSQAFIHGGRCYLRMSSFNHLRIRIDPQILPPKFPRYGDAALRILTNYEPLVRLAVCLLSLIHI